MGHRISFNQFTCWQIVAKKNVCEERKVECNNKPSITTLRLSWGCIELGPLLPWSWCTVTDSRPCSGPNQVRHTQIYTDSQPGFAFSCIRTPLACSYANDGLKPHVAKELQHSFDPAPWCHSSKSRASFPSLPTFELCTSTQTWLQTQ